MVNMVLICAYKMMTFEVKKIPLNLIHSQWSIHTRLLNMCGKKPIDKRERIQRIS